VHSCKHLRGQIVRVFAVLAGIGNFRDPGGRHHSRRVLPYPTPEEGHAQGSTPRQTSSPGSNNTGRSAFRLQSFGTKIQAPILEEVLFRGPILLLILFGHPIIALLVAIPLAIIFASMHSGTSVTSRSMHQASALKIAIIFTAAIFLTHMLSAAIALHMLNNIVCRETRAHRREVKQMLKQGYGVFTLNGEVKRFKTAA